MFGLGTWECLVIFVFGSILLLGTLLWLWMLVDCLINEPSAAEKILWAVLIFFTHWLGALIYLLVRRPARIRQYGK